MKKSWGWVLTGCAMVCAIGFSSGDATAGRIVDRQVSQEERIERGVASGELTHREARHLRHEQARIRQTKRAAMADGVVTRAERHEIERQQARASEDIHRLKHNDIER